MRDPKRISQVVETLQRVWSKFPDLRLCQLLENAILRGVKSGGMTVDEFSHCMYNLEDDDLIVWLERYEKEYGNPNE